MVNLKKDKKEMNEYPMAMEESPYPYGLHICLCDDVMKKLGLDIMPVGSEITFTAKAYVKSMSEREDLDKEDGDTNKGMDLQITDMDIDMAHDSDVAKRFYGEDEDK